MYHIKGVINTVFKSSTNQQVTNITKLIQPLTFNFRYIQYGRGIRWIKPVVHNNTGSPKHKGHVSNNLLTKTDSSNKKNSRSSQKNLILTDLMFVYFLMTKCERHSYVTLNAKHQQLRQTGKNVRWEPPNHPVSEERPSDNCRGTNTNKLAHAGHTVAALEFHSNVPSAPKGTSMTSFRT
jgi:hypothetical protein